MAGEPLGDARELGNPAYPPELTAQQRAESRQYGRRELTCTLVDMAIDIVYLARWRSMAVA